MKEPVDHIIRPQLPWRGGEAAITECGYDAGKVKAVTREEHFGRLKDLGRQRTAMITCMTCMDTAARWPTWEDDPRKALEREITWECGLYGYRDDRGTRLLDELLAIAKLVGMHREKFLELIEVMRRQRAWVEQKENASRKRQAQPSMRGL
jgi:hypothetical protein